MDYSTRTRPELLKLCKDRGLSGAGTNEDMIERLQAQDADAAGQGVDDDPLADEDAADEGVPAAADKPAAEKTPAVAEEPTPATEPVANAPADTSEQADDKPQGPQAHVKEGVTGNVFRFEYYLDREIDDDYHRHLIRETHHNAQAAGHRTKGFPTVGHRVRYDADGAGKRTAVYEVYLASGKPNGLRRP